MDAVVNTMGQMETQEHDWGPITWLVSGAIGNSDSMTFGSVVIRTGCGNPAHAHDNCDEILHLLEGELDHAVGADEVFHMRAGDTITLPAGVMHSARSVGEGDAVMVVAYSDPDRQVRGE